MVVRSNRRRWRLSLPGGSSEGRTTVDPADREKASQGVTAGWRERLPDATPLFVIGIASFAISYFTFHTLPVSGEPRFPLWSLFSAAGAMVVGGGAAVVIAGGEPDDPPYNSTEVVVLSRGEYAEMVQGLERLTEYEGGPFRAPPSGRPSAWPPTAVAARPTASFVTGPLEATRSPAPTPPLRSRRSEIVDLAWLPAEDAATEPTSEPAWKELPEVPKANEPRDPTGSAKVPSLDSSSPWTSPAAEHTAPQRPSPIDPTFERTLNELEAALDSLTVSSNEAVATSHVSNKRESSSTTSTQETQTLRRRAPPGTTSRHRTVCTTCGSRVEDARVAACCEVCEESLCPTCQLRAEYEGHSHTCARCQGILALAEEDDKP